MNTTQYPNKEPLAPDLIAPARPSSVAQTLVDNAALTEDEDRRLYQLIYDALVEEVSPKSFLDRLEVKDFVDVLWEEQRFRTSLTSFIDRAKIRFRQNPSNRPGFLGLTDEELETKQAACHLADLPIIEGLSRLVDNKGATRRAIHKALREMAYRNKVDLPLTGLEGRTSSQDNTAIN